MAQGCGGVVACSMCLGVACLGFFICKGCSSCDAAAHMLLVHSNCAVPGFVCVSAAMLSGPVCMQLIHGESVGCCTSVMAASMAAVDRSACQGARYACCQPASALCAVMWGCVCCGSLLHHCTELGWVGPSGAVRHCSVGPSQHFRGSGGVVCSGE